MKKNLLSVLSICLIALFNLSIDKTIVNAKVENESNQKVVYETNFEGMIVDQNSTVDNNTGFIWANNWKESKTILKNNTTMLDFAIYDDDGNGDNISVIGGLGIASKSNLSKCNYGEAYDVSLYVEMENIEKMYVEFVGGSKWGSVIVHPDGTLEEDVGGTAISNVSYVNNILNFTFTMSFNEVEGVNGYIQFSAFNPHSGHVYIDDVSIKHTKYILNDDLDSRKIGVFDTKVAGSFNNFYAVQGVTSSYVKHNNSTQAKMSFTHNQNNEGLETFYINKLGFLNKNRDYQMSFDMEVENVSNIWIYHGGTWCQPVSYTQINLENNSIETFGNSMKNVTYNNYKLTFEFNTFAEFDQWQQFEFLIQAKNANVESNVYLDNLLIYQTPIVSELELYAKGLKTNYYYGEELDLKNLNVNAIYSNDDVKKLTSADYKVSGYDKNVLGIQEVIIQYEGVTASFDVIVNRKILSLSVDTSKTKLEYNYGEELDFSSLVVKAKAENFVNDIILSHGAVKGGYSIYFGEYNPYVPGTYTILITYLNEEVTFDVIVKNRNALTFDSISYSETGK